MSDSEKRPDSPGQAPDHPAAPWVVGIGASAGGLEALEAFFSAVSPDSGLAYVVVQHLSPDFKSHMSELLARVTNLPLRRVTDGTPVEANTIYLNPARKDLTLQGGSLRVEAPADEDAVNRPIDVLFKSLASELGERAIGVVLSGTGSDGSQGGVKIHQAGGLVVAQDPESARFDGMPNSALATGVVDLTLSPSTIPEALEAYRLNGQRIDPDRQPFASSPELESALKMLRSRHGLDFTQYRESTIERRLERRRAMAGDADLTAYLDRLGREPAEQAALIDDLLIGVTRFFRDPEAFEVLERQILPELFRQAEPGRPIRVWIAGCASGEEAYSVAILFDELLQRTQSKTEVKIFATDVDRRSLERAGAGVYPESALEDVSPSRRAHYFEQRDQGYRIAPELRQMLVFAPHDLLHDAPFTQLDLLLCRNMLIYLRPRAQQKVLSLFHFGLKTGGVLWLGPSESPGEIAAELEIIDRRWKMYRKLRDIRPSPVIRPQIQSPPSHLLAAAGRQKTDRPDPPVSEVSERLLQLFMPPSFLITDEGELVNSFGGAERLLRLPAGRATMRLTDLVEEDLATPIASAVNQARREHGPVRYSDLTVDLAEGPACFHLLVRPLHQANFQQSYLLVQLDSAGAIAKESGQPSAAANVGAMAQDRIDSLESDLRFTRENLQATLEELEASNEELQASNQELVASNEELQSTNEELHSVNEELYTVNAEYQRKIEELTRLTDDMDNLLATTAVGVIFLDRELRIRRFTPEIAHTFRLLPQDLGRPIDSFSHNLEEPDLEQLLQEVLESETPIERKVRDRKEVPYLLRILPYRTQLGVEGVVLTLIDVSLLETTERELERFRFMSEQANEAHLLVDEAGQIVYVNPQAAESLGYTSQELLTKLIFEIGADGSPEQFSNRFDQAHTDGLPLFETELTKKGGGALPVEVSVAGVEFQGERYAFVSLRDLTVRRRTESRTRAEHRVTQVLAEHSSLNDALPALLDGFLDTLDLKVGEHWQPKGDRMVLACQRFAEDDLVESWSEASREIDFVKGQGLIGRAWSTAAPFWLSDLSSERSFARLSAAEQAKLVSGFAFPVLGEGDRCLGVLAFFSNRRLEIDDQLLATMLSSGREIGQFVRRSSTEQALLLRDQAISEATDGIMLTTGQEEDFAVTYVNRGFERITGYSQGEILGRNCRFLQGPETNPEALEQLRAGLRAQLPCGVSLLNYRKDGSTFWNDLQLTPVAGADGTVERWIGVAHDISEMKAVEEQLRVAGRQAEAASEAKSEFLANVSHELRSPLTAVLGFTEILLSRLEDAESRRQAESVRRNAMDLMQLIDDVLDLSKIEAGKVDVNKQPFSLLQMMYELENQMRMRASDKGLELDVRCQGPFPERVITDPVRLRQILVNLMGNAVKFTEEGRVSVTARYRPRTHRDTAGDTTEGPADGTIELVIADTGVGISADQQEHLFAPFTQADSSLAKTHGGTGLGLSITRRLVDSLGAEMNLDSTPGKGTTFTIELEVSVQPGPLIESSDWTPPSPEPESFTPKERLQGRVLVVDDLDDIRNIVRFYLEQCGLEVVSARDGESAVQAVLEAENTERPFDLVLMDMQMPGKSGRQATRELRQSGFHKPIIALTAAALTRQLEEARHAGCDHCLTKPIDGHELTGVLAQYLKSGDSKNEAEPHSAADTRPRVLLVEDHQDTAEAIATLLDLEGYEVRTAIDAEMALSEAAQFGPQVVITDLLLPGIDGYELVEALRKESGTANARFIALSGLTAVEDDPRFRQVGFHHSLTKPVNLEELGALCGLGPAKA